MKALPTLDMAISTVREIAVKRAQYGKHYRLAIQEDKFLDIIQVIAQSDIFDRPTNEDLARANRQAGAANARYAKCRKALGKDVEAEEQESL